MGESNSGWVLLGDVARKVVQDVSARRVPEKGAATETGGSPKFWEETPKKGSNSSDANRCVALPCRPEPTGKLGGGSDDDPPVMGQMLALTSIVETHNIAHAAPPLRAVIVVWMSLAPPGFHQAALSSGAADGFGDRLGGSG